MLRLPHLRKKLADTTAPAMIEIFEHYDLAVSKRDVFRSEPVNVELAEEYEQFCQDLEQETQQQLG